MLPSFSLGLRKTWIVSSAFRLNKSGKWFQTSCLDLFFWGKTREHTQKQTDRQTNDASKRLKWKVNEKVMEAKKKMNCANVCLSPPFQFYVWLCVIDCVWFPQICTTLKSESNRVCIVSGASLYLLFLCLMVVFLWTCLCLVVWVCDWLCLYFFCFVLVSVHWAIETGSNPLFFWFDLFGCNTSNHTNTKLRVSYIFYSKFLNVRLDLL